MTRSPAVPSGTLVLDCEGLAKATIRDPEVGEWVAAAHAGDKRVITSAATLVEVAHPGMKWPALQWTLSRVTVEPVTEAIAQQAAALLRNARLHGHKYAVDAMLCATALAASPPVVVLSSDPHDIRTLCSGRVRVVKV